MTIEELKTKLTEKLLAMLPKNMAQDVTREGAMANLAEALAEPIDEAVLDVQSYDWKGMASVAEICTMQEPQRGDVWGVTDGGTIVWPGAEPMEVAKGDIVVYNGSGWKMFLHIDPAVVDCYTKAETDERIAAAVNAEADARQAADTALSAAITAEATARANADTALGERIDSEASARESADATLQGNIDTEASARESADDALDARIDGEETAREQADGELQAQIDAISSKSDVVDVVASYAELVAYDTSALFDNDVVKVLHDETQDDAESYYRWNLTTQTWGYIGSQGPFVTPAEMQTALNGKVDKVSGKGLSTNDYTTTEKNKLDGIEAGANKTTVDSALSDTSTNPVQNKVVKAALDEKLGYTDSPANIINNQYNVYKIPVRYSSGFDSTFLACYDVTSFFDGTIVAKNSDYANFYGTFYVGKPQGYGDPVTVDFCFKVSYTQSNVYLYSSSKTYGPCVCSRMENSVKKYYVGFYYGASIYDKDCFLSGVFKWNSTDTGFSHTSGFLGVSYPWRTYPAGEFLWTKENGWSGLFDAVRLFTARNLKVNLASESAQSFDGSANAESIGVDGTLPITRGGTGATTAAGARTNLGLGNVENESVSDGTPDFTEATTRANIASGEKMSVLFGKIKKWFTDLKALAFKDKVSDGDINGTLSDSHIASASTWNGKANADGSNATGTWDININGTAGYTQRAGLVGVKQLEDGDDLDTVVDMSYFFTFRDVMFVSWDPESTISHAPRSGERFLVKIFGVGYDTSGFYRITIVQQAWGEDGSFFQRCNVSDTWSEWKEIALSDGSNVSGTWDINISGRATNATNATNAQYGLNGEFDVISRTERDANLSIRKTSSSHLANLSLSVGSVAQYDSLVKCAFLYDDYYSVVFACTQNGNTFNGRATTASDADSQNIKEIGQTNTINLNDCTSDDGKVHWYTWSNTNKGKVNQKPTDDVYTVQTIPVGTSLLGTFVMQIAYKRGTDEVYVRRKSDSTIAPWTSWRKIAYEQ